MCCGGPSRANLVCCMAFLMNARIRVRFFWLWIGVQQFDANSQLWRNRDLQRDRRQGLLSGSCEANLYDRD